jgi:hypothetical protein
MCLVQILKYWYEIVCLDREEPVKVLQMAKEYYGSEKFSCGVEG